MKPVLPPGLSAGDFAESLDALRRIVGAGAVFTGEQLAAYADPYSIVSPIPYSRVARETYKEGWRTHGAA